MPPQTDTETCCGAGEILWNSPPKSTRAAHTNQSQGSGELDANRSPRQETPCPSQHTKDSTERTAAMDCDSPSTPTPSMDVRRIPFPPEILHGDQGDGTPPNTARG